MMDYKTGINVPTRILSNQTIELLRATKEHWMLTSRTWHNYLQNFIIAHELGHIALGHINNKKLMLTYSLKYGSRIPSR